MTQYILTAVDLSGIQSYIFNSNVLKHIIGASELVYRATHQWVFKTLNELGPTNITETGDFQPRAITTDHLTSELIYAGGGNAVIIFQSEATAKSFAQKLTYRALREAPGLELVIAHVHFEWGQGRLADIVKRAFDKLGDKKSHRIRSTPLLGLGVTAACQFVGTPAVDEDDEKRLISAEIQAKQEAEPFARARLKKEADWPEEFSLPVDFDHFGRTRGESSLIAVVHADGNGIGKRIKQIANAEYPDNFHGYIQAMRAFSEKIKDHATDSLKATIKVLENTVHNDKIGDKLVLERDKKENKPYLPFRPLVFGGDDLTFVCEGRLGLTLTAHYLDYFTHKAVFPPDDTPIYARAGVAVVKTHYPFVRAYNLAEELAKSAKKYIDNRPLSAMDWHFAVGGMVLDLEEIRAREYTIGEEDKLYMRPVRVVGETSDWQSWAYFSKMVSEFQKDAQNGNRSKIKTLREVLRDGEAQVRAFVTNHKYALPNVVANNPHLAETGWDGKRCGYFDAIEAMEFFEPLAIKKEESPS